jgi:hypothetical protein
LTKSTAAGVQARSPAGSDELSLRLACTAATMLSAFAADTRIICTAAAVNAADGKILLQQGNCGLASRDAFLKELPSLIMELAP